MEENNEKGEIVLYQPEGEIRLEVRVENETVWLTQAQMAELFSVKENTITYHIQEIFETDELDYISTTRKIRVVRKEGKRNVARRIDFYNLDMIISIGYRVNSKTGVRFRRWANQVLKDYMLKGYAVNQRMVATGMQIANQFQEQQRLIEDQGTKLENVDTRLSTVEQHIDFFVKAAQTPTGGILATGTRRLSLRRQFQGHGKRNDRIQRTGFHHPRRSHRENSGKHETKIKKLYSQTCLA
jgi:hypothetical protein